MSRDGLTTEDSDSDDGRGKKITLTAKGLALLQKVLPEHYQRISRLMSNLDWTEQQNLVHTLEKLLQPR